MHITNATSNIFIAKHRGMVGSAIVRQLLAAGHAPASLVTRTHAELDLTDQASKPTVEHMVPKYADRLSIVLARPLTVPT